MKDFLSAYRVYRRLTPSSLALLCFAFVLCLTSCNKVGQLVDRLTDSVGEQSDSNATVDEMNQQEAKALIAKDSKLVIVEFYTDT